MCMLLIILFSVNIQFISVVGERFPKLFRQVGGECSGAPWVVQSTEE